MRVDSQIQSVRAGAASRPKRYFLTLVGRGVVVGLAIRVLWLSVRYFTHLPGVFRFQLESASVAFIVVGLALSLGLCIRVEPSEVGPSAGPLWVWGLWCLAAFVLYWPALHIGFLSDDFVLVERAHHLEFGAFNPESFRPLPIAVWSVILRLGGGASSIHAFNIVVHGTNAFLASRLTRSTAVDWRGSILAGTLLLVTPLGPEAVAWNSGVFDLTASALMLTAVAVARGYGDGHTASRRRLLLVLAAGGAFLCKETAVVIGPLIALDALVRKLRSRQLYVDAIATTLVMVGVIGLRLLYVASAAKQPITKYVVQRWLFGTIGSLVVPWHVEVLSSHRWMPIACVVAVVTLMTVWFVQRQTAEQLRLVAGAAGWTLLATLPTITMFFVASDLQGSRYLYFASVGYAALLTTAASATARTSQHAHKAAFAALCLLIGCGSLGVRWHLRPWEEASAVRRPGGCCQSRVVIDIGLPGTSSVESP